MRRTRVLALAAALMTIAGVWHSCTTRPTGRGRTPLFEDAAEKAGIRFRHFQGRRSTQLPEDMGSGACWGDVDGDGNLDLYLVNAAPLDPAKAELGARPRNVLYRNRGGGAFEEVTDTAGVAGRGMGMGCVFGDLDNDSRQDLLVTGYEGNLLYRNEGGWKFSEVAKEAGLADSRWGTGACLGDYDNDGRLDLYIPRYVSFKPGMMSKEGAAARGGFNLPAALSPFTFPAVRNSLYRNEGSHRFRDVSRRSGAVPSDRKGLQCLFADLDEDGLPDLYVADDVSADVLLSNQGDGRFADVTQEAGLGEVRSSMGLALGDHDGDGDLDLFVTQWRTDEKSLYINLLRERRTDRKGHRLHFADGNDSAGLGDSTLTDVGWGTGFFDYDNDGWLDLLIVTGSTFEEEGHPERLIAQRMRLFHNNGNGTFTDVTAQAGPGFQTPLNARGAAFADYDNDGRVDVAVNVNGGKALLLHNIVRNGNHWLEVRLHGTASNRDGVGARVTARTPDGRAQVCLVTAGGSYLSGNSLTCHFGLGRQQKATRLDVAWPSGASQTLEDVAADRILNVIETGRPGR